MCTQAKAGRKGDSLWLVGWDGGNGRSMTKCMLCSLLTVRCTCCKRNNWLHDFAKLKWAHMVAQSHSLAQFAIATNADIRGGWWQNVEWQNNAVWQLNKLTRHKQFTDIHTHIFSQFKYHTSPYLVMGWASWMVRELHWHSNWVVVMSGEDTPLLDPLS